MRGLSRRFTNEMLRKLARARQKYGDLGWDRHWQGSFMEPRGGYRGFFMKRLQEEVLELAIALDGGDEDDILQEAADVANFAMFIADFHQEKP